MGHASHQFNAIFVSEGNLWDWFMDGSCRGRRYETNHLCLVLSNIETIVYNLQSLFSP